MGVLQCPCQICGGKIESMDDKQEITNDNLDSKLKDDKNIIISAQLNLKSSTTNAQSPINDESVFPSKYIREDEQQAMSIISKRSIISLLESEFENPLYKEMYNKNDMIFSMNLQGSIFNKDTAILRISKTLNKSQFLDKELNIYKLTEYLYKDEYRSFWDKSMATYKTYEDDGKGFSILYTAIDRPVFFISQRDLVDKKFDFFEGGKFYSFSSSINQEYVPIKEDVVRTIEYLSLLNLWEDDKNFYIRSLSQIDFKVNVPQAFFGFGFPMKMNDWYKTLINFCNNYYNDKDIINKAKENKKTDNNSDD